MKRDPLPIRLAAILARLPFNLVEQGGEIQPPRKVLILKPCCMSQVMLATPLLAALSEAYPQARFDWAVSDWARPAIAPNRRLTELVGTGTVGQPGSGWAQTQTLIERLKEEAYDTCFIPDRSALHSWIAWRAGIPQRIGLDVGGQGFAHTLRVPVPEDVEHEAAIYLLLAQAVGIEQETRMEFFPPDRARARVTERLVEDIDWLAERPLVILHPGGGDNPLQPDERKRWPVERFSLLGNAIARETEAQILVVGAERDRPLAETVVGLMSLPAANLAGQLSLGELGALCEVADLYVGNDAGPTHIAVAVGCPTLAIFGPSDPALSGPYTAKGKSVVLRPSADEPFTSWAGVVPVEEALQVARQLLNI